MRLQAEHSLYDKPHDRKNQSSSTYFEDNTSAMFGPPMHIHRFYYNFSLSNQSDWEVRDTTEVGLKLFFLLVVGIPSIVANTIILFLVVRHKTLHNGMYMCIGNICVADLLLSLYSPWVFMTFHVRRYFIMGDFICHFSAFFDGKSPSLYSPQSSCMFYMFNMFNMMFQKKQST